MRWLPLLAFMLTGVLLASCSLMQQVHSPPSPQTAGISVGQTAPDIVGEDLEGVRFKLSDYRGKVVVVVFWGNLVPAVSGHVSSRARLVARLAGQPFVLLGVNSDANRETVKNFANAMNLTWRMWWDGSTPGPIVEQYQIQSWPAIFVLDEHGVVRYRNVRGPELDRAVDALLREMSPTRH